MWPIIDDHTIDKHGDSPIIDDFCTQKANSVTLALKAAFRRTTIFLFTNKVGFSSPQCQCNKFHKKIELSQVRNKINIVGVNFLHTIWN